MTRRILIIDDDDDIRVVVQLALQKFCGWSAIAAETGRLGIEQARLNELDVILLDVSMPDMDGFVVFQQLQTDPNTRSIPVILLTAKVLTIDRQQFATMPVAGVITKPFDPVTIGTQITRLLRWDQ